MLGKLIEINSSTLSFSNLSLSIGLSLNVLCSTPSAHAALAPAPEPNQDSAPEEKPPAPSSEIPNPEDSAQKTQTEATQPKQKSSEEPSREMQLYHVRMRLQNASTMMWVGYAGFAATYLVTSISAAGTFDYLNSPASSNLSPDERRDIKAEATWGVIPIAGPFGAAAYSPSNIAKWFWVVSGISQTAFLTVGIIGTVNYVKRKKEYKNFPQVSLFPTRDGAFFNVSGRF